jgi:hypothetical protein
MFWAIALINMGITAPAVVYVGQFEQQEVCMVALKDLQRQGFKGTCIQMIKPQVATEVGKK